MRWRSSPNKRAFSMAMTAWAAKILQERYLLGRNRMDLLPEDEEQADGSALAEQRHPDHRPDAALLAPPATKIGTLLR